MIRLLKQHEDWVLAGTGVFLAVLIMFLMAWSVSRLSRDLSAAANGSQAAPSGTSFNMEKARSLDLKGLSQ